MGEKYSNKNDRARQIETVSLFLSLVQRSDLECVFHFAGRVPRYIRSGYGTPRLSREGITWLCPADGLHEFPYNFSCASVVVVVELRNRLRPFSPKISNAAVMSSTSAASTMRATMRKLSPLSSGLPPARNKAHYSQKHTQLFLK